MAEAAALETAPPALRTAPPCSVIIFGASGDLARRKILPALYQLWTDRLLQDGFSVVGFARSPMSDEEFRKKTLEAVNEFGRSQPLSAREWEPFAKRLRYVQGAYDDPAAFARLKAALEEGEKAEQRPARRIFYLSVPPNVYGPAAGMLEAAGLAQDCGAHGCTRLIVEKPFGSDLASARELNRALHEFVDERQIYRIDHYLGKEAVQNILVMRFANGIFEPIWNRRYIDHVQITAAETLGVEGRAGYYDPAGCLRDMFQNHMLQLLAMVAMEPPASFDAEHVRDEKMKVLQAVSPLGPDRLETRAVRGQYGKGRSGTAELAAYREEPGVDRGSVTETFAALRLNVDNWRWADVPFYLRSGKRLPSRVTEVHIQFKRAPHLMFKDLAGPIRPDRMTLRIQPDEGITLAFEAKLPGTVLSTRQVQMEFKYATAFGAPSPEAYERLLLDCMLGDATLFNRADSVEASWALMMPVLDAWRASPPAWFPNYAAGTWGPPEADALIERDGRAWVRPA